MVPNFGFMTPFVWMFISSYEQLRNRLINNEVITSLVQLEYSGFDGAKPFQSVRLLCQKAMYQILQEAMSAFLISEAL